ncbi:MAG: EAL domain-containing protein [Lachnospiraceae bacterium]|nr:EAL domain-containing protein [Lachnospiraceae bacterium]
MQTYDEIFTKIAEVLLIDYTSVYYVNLKTNEYYWFSVDAAFNSLHIEPKGDDFFVNIVRDSKQVVYPDDLHIFTEEFQKEKLLADIQTGKMEQIEYRLVIDGKPVYHALRVIHSGSGDEDYLVLGVMNIDKEFRERKEAKKNKKEREVFNQIAGRLARHFDMLCYIEADTGNYSEFTSIDTFEKVLTQVHGENFFESFGDRLYKKIHLEDRDRIVNIIEKDYLISTLEKQRTISEAFRYYDDNRNVHHGRIVIMWANDKTHFILGIENIDEEIKKEKEHLKALSFANEKARRDELTGTKNKTAYHEFEEKIQNEIESGICAPFAVVICDINDLKIVNDTQGHKAGDEYIRSSCRMICKVFSHSPVFRVGGDEFAVVLKGIDYDNREDLLSEIRNQVLENINTGEGPIVATGISEFLSESDKLFFDVFDRADKLMYENKTSLKEQKILKETYAAKDEDVILIPEDRKKRVDELFKAFSVVAEGTYVYLCDMKYDYSRWSKSAVDTFGLPSEYMYHAGDIWEERIHPDDRAIYHIGIGDIFTGNSSGHDMQYRARRVTGEFDVCTCRGFVLKDKNGKPEYFAGSIRNHGLQGNVDNLTGLRNQYGFFEDIKNHLSRCNECYVTMIGLSKFSEINEVYGYQFGNIVLQKFARYMFEYIGNNGVPYRLDGTKFAIITQTLRPTDILIEYEKFRNHFRGNFYVDDKCIPLELNAGLIKLDNYDINYQTLYACLSFAYDESKKRKHGDLVEFYNDLNDENRQRIEKLQAIRTSISHDFEGFYLLYQPVVDTKTEKLIGAEALLRWRNDKFGVVPPNVFIPLLELDSLFPSLGNWILKKAITDAKRFLEKNPDFVINVNLSYTQLERSDFTQSVEALLKELDFPADHLCLEITERCRMLNLELLNNAIVNLRGMGIKIALDDFGTGYSSIGLVKFLDFDVIKIDRSFVTKIEEEMRDRELLLHFSKIASTFDAKVCVEGVETPGMRDILKTYQVNSLQGYYYAKPLEPEMLLAWEKPAEEK